MRSNREVWSVVTCLFVDDTVLLAESEGDLQRVVNEFYSVCKSTKLKVNAGKSNVMVFERREEVINFNTSYRVRLPAVAINQKEHTPGGALRRQPYDAKPDAR